MNKRRPWWRRFLLVTAIGLPALAMAQPRLAPAEVAQVEKTMADWLADPHEFGVAPRQVRYLRTVAIALAGEPTPVTVHLVEYRMPNGVYGRGFVNPLAWSFLGQIPYDKLSDQELVTSYLGWLWMFSAIQEGRATPAVAPQALAPLLADLARDGVRDVVVTESTKVGTLEFYAFTGIREGKAVAGAGSGSSRLVLDAASPQAALPVLYTYLGLLMQGKI